MSSVMDVMAASTFFCSNFVLAMYFTSDLILKSFLFRRERFLLCLFPFLLHVIGDGRDGGIYLLLQQFCFSDVLYIRSDPEVLSFPPRAFSSLPLPFSSPCHR